MECANTQQLTIVFWENDNRNKSLKECTPVLSTVAPPNITPLLLESVWILKPAHGGGQLPVVIGTFQLPEENAWYHYDVIHNVIPDGDELTCKVCISFVKQQFGMLGCGIYWEPVWIVIGIGPNPPITSKLSSALILNDIIPEPRFLIGPLSGELLIISLHSLVTVHIYCY